MDAPTGSDGTDSTFSWAASQRFSQRSWADFNPSQARCGKCAALIEPAALACRRCVSPTPVGCPRSWMDTTLNSHSAPAVRQNVPMSSSFSSPFGPSQMRRRSKTSDNVPLQRKGSWSSPLGMFARKGHEADGCCPRKQPAVAATEVGPTPLESEAISPLANAAPAMHRPPQEVHAVSNSEDTLVSTVSRSPRRRRTKASDELPPLPPELLVSMATGIADALELSHGLAPGCATPSVSTRDST